MTKTRYYRLVAWTNCAVPGVLLAWDAARGQLGANSVNDAIRTVGLVALTLLILALTVTPIRRITGWNILIAVRRPLGMSAFYYACAHVVLYVSLDRGWDLRSTWHELATRRYLQVGLLVVLLLIPLAITSTDNMVRRLGAKRWGRLHRIAYIATAGGLLHYYLLVKSDVRQPLAFAGVFAGLMIFRAVASVADRRRQAQQGKKAGAYKKARTVAS